MIFRNIFIALFLLFANINLCFAEGAAMNFELVIPEYLNIKTVTSAVLTANITDKTGNLYAPLSTKFRIISNTSETKTLYLKAEAITENGIEPAMFDLGGRVYVAFTNLENKPKSSALSNCKMGTEPKYSAGVVAYPITSVIGAHTRYQWGQGKYKVEIKNGTTELLVNIGSNVLPNSFDSRDKKGFYQATLSLTESDI